MLWESYDDGPHGGGFEPDAEDQELYRPGGLCPIDIGELIGPDAQFEVCQKSGYDKESTEWIVRDHEQEDWKLVKTYMADDPFKTPREFPISDAPADSPTKSLLANHIVPSSGHFWQKGPNGRHLCLVYPALGPPAPADGINRENPDELIDLCFQLAEAVAFLHRKGLCHGELKPKNVRMLMDTEIFREKIRNVRDLKKHLGKPITWELRSFKEEDRHHGPARIIRPASLSRVEVVARTKKIGIVCTNRWYRPKDLLKMVNGRFVYPARLHPGKKIRGTDGLTGFPSDIWDLACLFGEIRTQTKFVRRRYNYGTPLKRAEIDEYLSAERFLPPTQFRAGTAESSGSSDVSDSPDSDTTESDGSNTPEDNFPARLKNHAIFQGRDRSSANKSSHSAEQELGENVASPENETYTESSVETEKKRKHSDAQQADRESKSLKVQDSNKDDLVQSDATASTKESDKSSETNFEKQGTDILAEKHDKKVEDERETTTPTASSSVEASPKKEQRTDRLPSEKVRYRGYEYKMPGDEVSLLGDLLEKMFAPKPQGRITIEEVLKHEWFGDRRASLAPPPSPAK